VLDGSKRVDAIIRSSLEWDVMVGVSRRAWARNENSLIVARRWNTQNKHRGQITLPNMVDEKVLDKVIKKRNKF